MLEKEILFLFLSSLVVYVRSCPLEGWFLAGDSCYLVSPNKVNWFEAQQFCWNHGGYLAEIQTGSEDQALQAVLMTRESYWIGLNDIAIEGDYVWSETHEAASFTNWGPGEPNEDAAVNDCVMKCNHADCGGKWYDMDCNVNQTYDDAAWGELHALCEGQNGF